MTNLSLQDIYYKNYYKTLKKRLLQTHSENSIYALGNF